MSPPTPTPLLYPCMGLLIQSRSKTELIRCLPTFNHHHHHQILSSFLLLCSPTSCPPAALTSSAGHRCLKGTNTRLHRFTKAGNAGWSFILNHGFYPLLLLQCIAVMVVRICAASTNMTDNLNVFRKKFKLSSFWTQNQIDFSFDSKTVDLMSVRFIW